MSLFVIKDTKTGLYYKGTKSAKDKAKRWGSMAEAFRDTKDRVHNALGGLKRSHPNVLVRVPAED